MKQLIPIFLLGFLLTGCESTVGAIVEYTVPADIVSGVVVPSALVSEIQGPVGGTFIVRSVCDSNAGQLEDRRYDSHLGCRTEGQTATARAFIVPIPSSWDVTAFCESTAFDRNDFAAPQGFDPDELPAPTAADPQAEDTRPLGGQFLGCGGSANLELVLAI